MTKVLTWDGLPEKGTKLGDRSCTPARAWSESLNADIKVCKEGKSAEAISGGFSPEPRARRGRPKGVRFNGTAKVACNAENLNWVVTKRGRRCRCKQRGSNRFVANRLCEK